MYRKFMIMAACAAAICASADEPSGYYSSCEGLCGRQLIEALEDVISDHTAIGYSGLWTLYQTSDVYSDGKIWDMYSTKHWTYKSEQCGSYKYVGDCYNREHSFPKSWFDDAQPMYCDAFHIYPTDGKVNGQRSNYPYGECANGTAVSSHGGVQALGKLGSCTFPGYSGTVFEPDDQYKGDFARSYFYMAACYNRLIDDWDSDMLAGNTYPAFSSWAINLLLKWHRNDPVSSKELARNEVVYGAQGNRNPFIDHPELAEYIWGDHKTQPWSLQGDVDPVLSLPIDGSVFDFGNVAVGGESNLDIKVKGTGLSQAVTFNSTGNWFYFDRNSIPAAEANAADGTEITITWDPDEPGQFSSTVTFVSGAAQSTVTVKGTATDQLTANPATNVTDCSFVASWIYVGDEDADGCYTVKWREAGTNDVSSQKVRAYDCRLLIEDLQSSTEYEYWVESKTMTSNVVSVTIGAGIPSIQLMYDGDLYLQAAIGTPSQAYEIMVDVENVDTNISISVQDPFQVSTDKTNWSRSITIDPREDRFYLRLYGNVVGEYSTTINVVAGTYVNDNVTVEGKISESTGIIDLGPGLDGVESDYRSWDAYCRAGVLVVETQSAQRCRIYGVDGIIYYEGAINEGATTFNVPSGLYIIAISDFSRRVLVHE